MSNQGVWYLDHLDVPWEDFYTSEPLAGINNTAQQKLVLGGEVCIWGETANTSDVQQTIWPRAAAAAAYVESIGGHICPRPGNNHPGPATHFRCLLNHCGIAAAVQLQSQMPMLGGLQSVLVHALFSKLDLHSKYKHEEDLPPYTFYTFDKNGISLLVLYRFCMFTCIMLSHIHLTIKVHNPSLFISL